MTVGYCCTCQVCGSPIFFTSVEYSHEKEMMVGYCCTCQVCGSPIFFTSVEYSHEKNMMVGCTEASVPLSVRIES